LILYYIFKVEVFSLDNINILSGDYTGYYGGSNSYYWAIELILWSPIKEELLFRGIILITLLNRAPEKLFNCVLLTSILFGLSHILNVFLNIFSSIYIILQVII